MNQELIERIVGERKQGRGNILIYETHQRLMDKPRIFDSEEVCMQMVFFRMGVAKDYMALSNYFAASTVLERAKLDLRAYRTRPEGEKTYQMILLGLLKCYVYRREPLKSERIAKIEIRAEYLVEVKYYRQLALESNKMYWSQKMSWFTLIVILSILINTISFAALGFIASDIQKVIIWLTMVLYYLTSGYQILNQDCLSLDPLEIFTTENHLRNWLNRRFGLTLGGQPDVTQEVGK